mmetsp:Transcript_5758/g.12779  ORF Transcript_5758/g.12779 Transcript_5758/m.12779 type:complete len:370 (-) Transcript_5758:52-1161(-)
MASFTIILAIVLVVTPIASFSSLPVTTFANHRIYSPTLHTRCVSKSTSSPHCQPSVARDGQQKATQLKLYRKFHEYGWSKLLLDEETDIGTVPSDLQSNTSPVKGASPGTKVVATIRSISQFPFLGKFTSEKESPVLRLARSAFLETQTPNNEAMISSMTIHVLNFVLFPNPHIRDENGDNIGLPLLGADIVSLPGNKHLVALDFQPVLDLSEENVSLIPKRYSHIETKLQSIHSKYQKSSDESIQPLLPWGGDIPEQAKRFFSPYALWTRLSDDNAMDTVSTLVWEAYQEYIDLYLELMDTVQKDVESGVLEIASNKYGGSNSQVLQGQEDYLEYRRSNDPARPMLIRLYGEDWAERVIGGVLFPDIK